MLAEVTLGQPNDATVSAPDRRGWLAWLLLPCIFLVLHGLFVHARGPYYLGSNFDPDYAYLCNSLNLAVGRSPYHIDHPGTPLQFFGVAVITLAHPFASKDQKIAAVLNRPEQHLRWINLTVAAIYASSLALVGIVVWRRTGDWQPALILQASPFLLGQHFYWTTRVNAEALLITFGLLMAALLFVEARAEGTTPRAMALLAFLAVTGVITKMNFFPLALVPLAALRNWKQRATFLLLSGVFGFVWFLPVSSHASRFLVWIKRIAFRHGDYGSSGVGLLPPDYLSHLLRLLAENLLLSVAVGVSCFTVLYGRIRWNRLTAQQRRGLLLLGGLAVGQTALMLIVAKYVTGRYLLPALMFCPLNLLLLIRFWGTRFPLMRQIVSGAVVLSMLLTAASLRSAYLRLSQTKVARMQIVHALATNFKGEPKIFYNGASSPYYALRFGNDWAGGYYSEELAAIFRSDPPIYSVKDFRGGNKLSFSDLRISHRSFLLVGSTRRAPGILASLSPHAKAEQVLLRDNEVIYRLTFE